MEELKKRKTPRYQYCDYNSEGEYFITICTQNRRCILSRVVGTGVLDCPQTELTSCGKIADKYIKQLNDFYDYLSVEEYVIMPNHVHVLLWVKENKNIIRNGQSRTPVPTVTRDTRGVGDVAPYKNGARRTGRLATPRVVEGADPYRKQQTRCRAGACSRRVLFVSVGEGSPRRRIPLQNKKDEEKFLVFFRLYSITRRARL